VGESQISQDDGIVKPSETSETWSQRLLGSSSSWVINKITDVKWQPCAQESQECNSMVSFHEVHMDGLMQANTGNFRKFRQWCHTQIWRHPNHSEVVSMDVSHYQILTYIYINIYISSFTDHEITMPSPFSTVKNGLNHHFDDPRVDFNGSDRCETCWHLEARWPPPGSMGFHGKIRKGGPKRQNHRHIGGITMIYWCYWWYNIYCPYKILYLILYLLYNYMINIL
jgi:hypothetical protein